MSKRGGLKKTCPACNEKIFNGFKMCPFCKAPQPKNLRLKKKIEKFDQKKKAWVANTKRNQVTSHLWDDAVILIEKLHTVGWRPLLLLEYPQKEAKLILPKDVVLGKDAQTCVINIYEMFTMMVEEYTNQATESSHESEEDTVTVHSESTSNPSTGDQDLTATMDLGAGTMVKPEQDSNQPSPGQDLRAGMSMDLGAGTEDGPELSLSPPLTEQDSKAAICMDLEAGTMVDPEQDLNQPPTGQGTRRNQKKKERLPPQQSGCAPIRWHNPDKAEKGMGNLKNMPQAVREKTCVPLDILICKNCLLKDCMG